MKCHEVCGAYICPLDPLPMPLPLCTMHNYCLTSEIRTNMNNATLEREREKENVGRVREKEWFGGGECIVANRPDSGGTVPTF